MIVTIIQPPYLPWLGFFNRVLKSDVLVLLDNVAMDRNSRTKFLNRNKLRTKEGWTWLTVPLVKGPREQPIEKLEINNEEPWASRHWKTIESCYRRAKFFSEFGDSLSIIYEGHWIRLVDLNCAILDMMFRSFGITPRIEHGSQLGAEGAGQELLIDICIKLGASAYISGPFGRDYIDPDRFRQVGVDLMFHDYEHPRYEQVFPGFEPYMSALDLLINYGRSGRDILAGSDALTPA